MPTESLELNIVLILTVGFVYAGILGYFAYLLKLSPIIGYLIAGYLIGPYSPGLVVDTQTSEQLAEIGVILMMFGVGLGFKWQDLSHIKKIAVPGAIIQTFVAAMISVIFIHLIGWDLKAALVFGLSIGVASTVVLSRVLSDNSLLNSQEGYIAIGWLIIEDMITILFLILIPVIASYQQFNSETFLQVLIPLTILLLKLTVLVAVIVLFGQKLVGFILSKAVKTGSQELFTLTVMALTFLIATGAAFLFSTSIALGAFIAGMIIGQTEVRHEAVVHSIHMKNIFIVIFFLSVGMLFNPQVIYQSPYLFLGTLAIILIIKPLTAFLICLIQKNPLRVSITVALALSQIGEFSFILAEEGMKFDILPDEGFDVLVACALISISLNSIFFKFISKPKNLAK